MTAWLQLMRLPNVFTALADVTMGYLVTHGPIASAPSFLLLAGSSCLLYLSGMVLNDVFDADTDAREHPGRPIPSGRVSRRAAAALGWALLASGLLVAWFLSAMDRDARPGAVATLLSACIVLYDRVLKRTPIAPIIMGTCRGLNVLLGMSLAPRAVDAAGPHVVWSEPAAWLIAAGIAVYVVGVTVFSRSDARISSRFQVSAGLALILAAVAILASVPVVTGNRPPLLVAKNGWLLLWIMLALITGRRCLAAIANPSPLAVQSAVRHCVQTIIVLDAAVCVGYAGPLWGFAILALLFPTVFLTAWLRAT